ncbi:helix-turn-helix domain-containing protein [Microvirga splendida]|uniref:Plasmid replication protein C N-terminal domain-containing protein n=1 Tax=Microvirga splendida TaxID=2795727 RepID=A0ABS0Y4D6_9HYPH|nr:hypothetical protein [Microvirga splendida]
MRQKRSIDLCWSLGKPAYAHSEGTIRALINLRLVVSKDSPNGKRYAVRDKAGVVVDAFGFDLTPIYARRKEWWRLLQSRGGSRTLSSGCSTRSRFDVEQQKRP